MKMNKDSQIEFINEEDLDLLGGTNETDIIIISEPTLKRGIF